MMRKPWRSARKVQAGEAKARGRDYLREELLGYGYIDESDLHLFTYTDDMAQALVSLVLLGFIIWFVFRQFASGPLVVSSRSAISSAARWRRT